MRARRARGASASTTCTRRCAACSPSRRCSSRRPGSGSRWLSARCSARSCSRTGVEPALGRRALAVSARRRLVGAGRARRAAARGRRHARRRPLGRRRFADARVDRAEDVLMARRLAGAIWGSGPSEQRAWAMYDWANSAFQCTIITAVFPIYFASVAADGAAAGRRPPSASPRRRRWRSTIIAILSPVLGAYADYAGAKKRLLAVFLAIGVIATAAMFFIGTATGSSPRCCSSSPTSASPAASSSTTRCCRTSPRPTRWTASRARATRSATSAAACCWRSTWRGS